MGFFFLSSAGLLTGLLRFELAVTLWGGAFLFLLLYTWIGNCILRMAVARAVLDAPEGFDFSIAAAGVYAGTAVRCRVRAVLPGFLLPAFFFSFRAPLIWKTRTCWVAGGLSPGKNEHSVHGVPRWRGQYRGTEVFLLVRDLFGFTSSVVRVESKNALTVYPHSRVPGEIPLLTGPGGELAARQRTVSRSDELLDARQYYPGDDIRRIHWNMYAHLGDLYIRVGEELPPPHSRVLVALDTSIPPRIPEKVLDSLLEAGVQAACGGALFFLQAGCEVWLSRSGALTAETVKAGDTEGVFRFFAEAWWNNEPLPRPDKGPTAVYLFSLPFSPGRDSFLEKNGSHTLVFLPDIPLPKKLSPRDVVRWLLFHDSKGAADVLKNDAAGRYKTLLETDIRNLQRSGREVRIYDR